MAGEIPIRAILGTLGIDQSGEAVIMGTRIPFAVSPSVSVPLSSTRTLVASFTVPTMAAGDALVVEYASGILFPSDASGKLVLQAVAGAISDTTSGNSLHMQTIAQLGTVPADTSAVIGLFLQPAPAVRCRDFKGGKPGDTITVNLQVTVQNTDAAVAHTFALVFEGIIRIISGVNP